MLKYSVKKVLMLKSGVKIFCEESVNAEICCMQESVNIFCEESVNAEICCRRVLKYSVKKVLMLISVACRRTTVRSQWTKEANRTFLRHR